MSVTSGGGGTSTHRGNSPPSYISLPSITDLVTVVNPGGTVTFNAATPLRSLPQEGSTVIGEAPKGGSATYLCVTDDVKWVRVTFRGVQGYVPEAVISEFTFPGPSFCAAR